MLRSKQNRLFAIIATKPGHKKSECHSLLMSHEKQPQGIFGNLILNEINMTIIKFGSWWADLGATAHISNTMQGFQRATKNKMMEQVTFIWEMMQKPRLKA